MKMGLRAFKTSCNASCEAFDLTPVIEQTPWDGRVLLYLLTRLRVSNKSAHNEIVHYAVQQRE